MPSIPPLVGQLAGAGYRTAGFATRSVVRPVRWGIQHPEMRTKLTTPGMVASVFADELMVGVLADMPKPDDDELRRVAREAEAGLAVLRSAGWLDDPAGFHVTPPAADGISFRSGKQGWVRYEEMSMESGYAPAGGFPWGSTWPHAENATARAFVMRHRDGAPRPWALLIHGYSQGTALDVMAMRSLSLFRKGFNVLHPVAPFHGERKSHPKSGRGMMSHDVVRNVNAFAQAVWDIRRWVGWAVEQGATSVGVHGVSMGGYLTGLTVALEAHVTAAVAGIPSADMVSAMKRRTPSVEKDRLAGFGLTPQVLEQIHRVVSPLTLVPLLPPSQLAIYGSVGDRIAGADDAYRLWIHWGRPRIEWLSTSHVGAMLSSRAKELVAETMALSTARRLVRV